MLPPTSATRMDIALIKHKSPAPHDDDTVPNADSTAWLESHDKERRQKT